MAVITEYIQPLLQGESLSFEQATSLLDIIFEDVNFYLLNILTSVLLVGILTYAVMPWLSRYVFRKWLYR